MIVRYQVLPVPKKSESWVYVQVVVIRPKQWLGSLPVTVPRFAYWVGFEVQEAPMRGRRGGGSLSSPRPRSTYRYLPVPFMEKL